MLMSIFFSAPEYGELEEGIGELHMLLVLPHLIFFGLPPLLLHRVPLLQVFADLDHPTRQHLEGVLIRRHEMASHGSLQAEFPPVVRLLRQSKVTVLRWGRE